MAAEALSPQLIDPPMCRSPDSVSGQVVSRWIQVKKKTYPNGLVAHFDDLGDFRNKFRRQMDSKIRELVASTARLAEDPGRVTPVPKLRGRLAAGEPPEEVAVSHVRQLVNVICTDGDEIPDLGDETGLSAIQYLSSNRDYYREVVDYYCKAVQRVSYRFAITNQDEVGLHDLYVELLVSGFGVSLGFPDDLPQPKQSSSLFLPTSLTGIGNPSAVGRIRMPATGGTNPLSIEWPVVQAQRTVNTSNEFYIAALASTTASIEPVVYFSAGLPFALETLNVQLEVENREMTFQEILRACGIDL
jgi:hypothetical protein